MEIIWVVIFVAGIVIGLVSGDWSHFNFKNGGASSEDDCNPTEASFHAGSIYHYDPGYKYLPGNIHNGK